MSYSKKMGRKAKVAFDKLQFGNRSRRALPQRVMFDKLAKTFILRAASNLHHMPQPTPPPATLPTRRAGDRPHRPSNHSLAIC